MEKVSNRYNKQMTSRRATNVQKNGTLPTENFRSLGYAINFACLICTSKNSNLIIQVPVTVYFRNSYQPNPVPNGWDTESCCKRIPVTGLTSCLTLAQPAPLVTLSRAGFSRGTAKAVFSCNTFFYGQLLLRAMYRIRTGIRKKSVGKNGGSGSSMIKLGLFEDIFFMFVAKKNEGNFCS